MIKDVFIPADILLPEGVAPELWSVVACDQFSSERDYWERVRENVNGEPSTLNMIIPEAYLDEIDEEKAIEKIRLAMDDYAKRGILREITNSFIYVERTQPDGRVRRGLIGTVDLEEYEFSGGEAAIIASEGTVLERLPPRIRIRRVAKFELPHIMTFVNDKDATIIEPLVEKTDSLPLLYDFELMEGGGHIKGWRVTGSDADIVMSAMRALHQKSKMLMVIGDGNHSLAAAKVYWDELKQGLDESSRANHPARYALLEVNNVYDPAITFEAIHRVLFGVEPMAAVSALEKAMPSGTDYELNWVTGEKCGVIGVSADCIGTMLTIMQGFLDDYSKQTGCTIDFIHGEDATINLAQKENCLGLILPAMDKSELFETVSIRGVFPKKSFSVGHARDKRYYLECRKLKVN